MNFNQTYLLQNILKTMACNFYAVARGRNVGIYNTWDECKMQVDQFPRAIFKKFHTKAQAEEFIKTKTDAKLSSGSGFSVRKFTKRPLSQKGTSSTNVRENSYSNNGQREAKRKCSIPICETTDVNEPGKYISNKDDYVNVYTDGACSSNGYKNAKAGIGVWFGDNHPLNVSRPVVGRATNNVAEIQAVTTAAQQAKKAGVKNLRINTDSQFLISCITSWMPKWKKNGWKTSNGMPVINKTELLEMEEALSSLNIEWNHVNGHVGIYGNEMADKLAKAGSQGY